VLRVVVMLTGVAIACATVAGSARADGDPAGDALVETNAFVPCERPAPAASAILARQVAAVHASGNRIKVAVIAAKNDLGAIRSLFGIEVPSPRSTYSGVQMRAFPVRYGLNLAGTRSCLNAVDAAGNCAITSRRVRS
jgi:hypothetical protein